MAGLELAFLLVQPYRGHLCSYQLSAWERAKALGKYTLDDGMFLPRSAAGKTSAELPADPEALPRVRSFWICLCMIISNAVRLPGGLLAALRRQWLLTERT